MAGKKGQITGIRGRGGSCTHLAATAAAIFSHSWRVYPRQVDQLFIRGEPSADHRGRDNEGEGFHQAGFRGRRSANASSLSSRKTTGKTKPAPKLCVDCKHFMVDDGVAAWQRP